MGQYDSQIWSDLHSFGLNDIAAAGVMGNMSQESSMNPAESGGGLMQWIGSRWNALVSYANQRGLDPHSETAQLGYFDQELMAGNEGITLDGLNSQGSPASAALYVSQNYERPNPAMANNAHRESEAARFYSEFSGSPIQGTGTIPGVANTSATDSAPPTANSMPTGSDVGNDPLAIIDKSLQIQKFSITNPLGSITQDAGAIALRTVIVIIGIIFIIFALVAIVEKAGVVPVPV